MTFRKIKDFDASLDCAEWNRRGSVFLTLLFVLRGTGQRGPEDDEILREFAQSEEKGKRREKGKGRHLPEALKKEAQSGFRRTAC